MPHALLCSCYLPQNELSNARRNGVLLGNMSSAAADKQVMSVCHWLESTLVLISDSRNLQTVGVQIALPHFVAADEICLSSS